MFSYQVKPGKEFHSKDGILVRRGDTLTGEDARWLELPEQDHLRHQCTRISAHLIDEGEKPEPQEESHQEVEG